MDKDELLELRLLKLVYDYSIKRKLVDNHFIEQLLDLMISANNLGDYVKSFSVTNGLPKDETGAITVAAYRFVKKEVLIDYESINFIMDNRGIYDCLFQELEQYMFRNLLITQFLLHELEHAIQNKKANDKSDNTIDAKLIRACFELEQVLKNPNFMDGVLKNHQSIKDLTNYISYNKELYRLYYDLNPTERLAEFNSYRLIVHFLKEIQQHIPNLYEFEQASLFESVLKGYSKAWYDGACPTQLYLLRNNKDNVWQGLDFYSSDPKELMKNVQNQYPLIRRLSLGLPIEYKEYDEIDRWLRGTNKFNI